MESFVSAGWTVSASMAGTGGQVLIRRGEDFAAPARGLLALLACGDPAGPEPEEAARLAAGLVAEGYFGARATLSPARAGAQALTSANAWLYGRQRSRPGMAASLAAVAFAPGGAVLLALGAIRVVLQHEGRVHEIAAPQVRPLRGGVEALRRGLGLDDKVFASAEALDLQPGDRLTLQGAATLTLEVAARLPAPFDPSAELSALALRPPPQEGDLLDGFRIGRTIYRGQYTLLRRAFDTVEGREVALKFPLPAMAQDAVFKQGFLREAWIGARLGSRWSVEYWEPPAPRRSQLYLVMPYLRGRTLEERLHTAPPVSLAEGVGVGVSVCEAIADLARRDVVHGDIKPENLFLTQDGALKLIDLGLASLAGLDAPQQDRLGGTTRYMAPELFRGAKPSQTTEVFALAVTLHRLFTGGEFPFGRRLLRSRPDLPRWLAAVLARALALDPAQRYADADALRAALLHGLAHEDWRGPPTRRFALDFWPTLALLLGALCLALALWRR